MLALKIAVPVVVVEMDNDGGYVGHIYVAEDQVAVTVVEVEKVVLAVYCVEVVVGIEQNKDNE